MNSSILKRLIIEFINHLFSARFGNPAWWVLEPIGSLGLQEAKRGGKVPGQGTKSHPLHGVKFPKTLPPALDELPQSEAKRYVPPGCYIWRLNTRAAWGVKVGRHSDKVEPFARHQNSSSKAMWACVKFAWMLYLEDNCLPADHCPFKGLL